MLYEYEIFRCKNTRTVKDDRRPEEEVLLDIVWASDEIAAVEKASAKWDIASDSLYAVQHIAVISAISIAICFLEDNDEWEENYDTFYRQ